MNPFNQNLFEKPYSHVDESLESPEYDEEPVVVHRQVRDRETKDGAQQDTIHKASFATESVA